MTLFHTNETITQIPSSFVVTLCRSVLFGVPCLFLEVPRLNIGSAQAIMTTVFSLSNKMLK
jgi:hypothetical protein